MKKEVKINKIIFVLEILLFIIIIILNTILYSKIKNNSKVAETASTEVESSDTKNSTNIDSNTEKNNTSNEQTETSGNPTTSYINEELVKNSKLTDWNLILVNKNNYIPEGFTVQTENIEISHQVDARIVGNLQQMLSDARKEGLDPVICSSFRTQEKQEYLYNSKVREYRKYGYSEEDSKNLASYWVAIPGTGEHQTGLAVDIVSEDYQILDEKQEETAEQKWLIENSYKYGFTLRYPTEKKEITMINYEPWHYRYVGVENATFMKENGMCLEEFIDYLKQNES